LGAPKITRIQRLFG